MLALWAIALLCAGFVYFFYDLPDIDKVKPLDIKPSIVILANDGTLIARYGGAQGAAVTMREVPPQLIAAILSVEDRRFYHHMGIDPMGLLRAVWTNIRAGHWVQGGSTITQQLAKNLFLTPDKTLRRKVQEAVMALKIERRYGKDRILLAYLNRVYFGAGAYGIDAAARTYFDKPVSRLTLWESAMLAGLLKAPARFSPAASPERALARSRVVLNTMQAAGYIDAAMAAQALRSARFPGLRAAAGDLNRYFADWVMAQIDGFVDEAGGDLVVRTTLDPKLQLLAEARQRALFKAIRPQDRVTQAALVTETHDGAVLAMIGGVSYAASQFNRATQALRQPGSAFKPFVYLAALEQGWTPDSPVEDIPLREGSYRPANYDDRYLGVVTLTEALTHSSNAAAVRLLQAVGSGKLADVVRRMGFAEKPATDLSAALGTGEVNLLELTNAYAIIANGGAEIWPYAILSIKDGEGRLLYQRRAPDTAQLFSGQDIAALDGMLAAAVAEGTGKSARLPQTRAAGKTGTTQNYRDAWFMGYAGPLVTGVWMGNDDNTPMKGVTGGRYPAQLWHDYMRDAVSFDVPVFVPEAESEESAANPFADVLSRWSAERGDPAYNQ